MPYQTSFYLIYLPKNTKRYENAQYQLHRGRIANCRMIEGIDGAKALQDNHLKKLVPRKIRETIAKGYRIYHDGHTEGTVGCYLAHLKAIKTFIETPQTDLAIIFEDDVDIPESFQSSLNQALFDLDSVDPGWNVAILGNVSYWEGSPKLEFTIDASRKIYTPKVFTGLNCYAVKRRAAFKILENTLPVERALDWQLSRLNERGVLKLYVYTPGISGLTWHAGDPETSIKYTQVKSEQLIVIVVVSVAVALFVIAIITIAVTMSIKN